MSKSRGNVVAPDDLVARYGADAVRCFLMFIGPWDQGGPWNPSGIEGMHRFLGRVWSVASLPEPPGRCRTRRGEELARAAARDAPDDRGVGDDTEAFRFNTASRQADGADQRDDEGARETWRAAGLGRGGRQLLLLLAPYAPHLAEELWARRGEALRVHQQAWPAWDPALAASDTVEMRVQVNGKVRDRGGHARHAGRTRWSRWPSRPSGCRSNWAAEPPRRVILIPGKLVNIVTG